jgi:hypothetical protein
MVGSVCVNMGQHVCTYLAGERHHDGTTGYDIQIAVNSWQSVNKSESEESV